MLKHVLKQLQAQSRRNFSTTNRRQYKVAVLGAAGGIGQPLSLLLKINPLVAEIALYDLSQACGLATDLSHIDLPSYTYGFDKDDEMLDKALECATLVVIPAGVPRKPGMTRDDLFDQNAGIIKKLSTHIAKVCPEAYVCIITNPVNSTVPIAATVLEEEGVYDPNKLFGITLLDHFRTRKFLAEELKTDPQAIRVPVICGHSNETIIPVLSQSHPKWETDDCTFIRMIKRIQNAGNEVIDAKGGTGSSTLSIAYAGALFCDYLLKAKKGVQNLVACAYVDSNLTQAEFFSSPVKFGKHGIEKIYKLPKLNEIECEILEKAMPVLLKNIEKGVNFAKNSS